MTRLIEEIEADVAEAKRAHFDATEARRVAKGAVHDLVLRARAGDETVTAAALAQAEDEASFSELGIEAKKAIVVEFEAELLMARTEQFADEVSAKIPPLRDAVEQSLVDAERALAAVAIAWRAHADVVQESAFAVGSTVSADLTPRVRRTARGVLVDGEALRTVPVHDRLSQLFEATHERLFRTGAQG